MELSRLSGSLVDRCPDDSLSECNNAGDTLSALRSNNIVDLDDESSVQSPVNFVCQVHHFVSSSIQTDVVSFFSYCMTFIFIFQI